jgi:dTDP-4-amino-4,6-dideoxygalactose transaminase
VPPAVRSGCRHVYYVWAARYDELETGVSRATIAKALNAEGVPVWEGYVKPLYFLPVFQRRIAIGSHGWPFTLTERRYEKGMCPVAENLFEKSLLEFCVCSYAMSESEQGGVIEAFRKVFANLSALAEHEKRSS